MLLRKPFVACHRLLTAARSSTASFMNKYGTDSKTLPSEIFEVRVYTSNSQDFKKAMTLINENIHIRQKYSKLFGFWTAELGSSIFQCIHIWEYDSLNHRLQARKTLLQDRFWQTEFLPQLFPYMQSMTNFLLAPTPGSTLNVDFKNDPAAVYELQTLKRDNKIAVPIKNGDKNNILVGTFTGVFGSTDSDCGDIQMLILLLLNHGTDLRMFHKEAARCFYIQPFVLLYRKSAEVKHQDIMNGDSAASNTHTGTVFVCLMSMMVIILYDSSILTWLLQS